MQEFISFVSKVMGVSPEILNENTAYGTIDQWDSLMHMRLVMEIEEEYDVEIPIDEITDIKTIKDFYQYANGQ